MIRAYVAPLTPLVEGIPSTQPRPALTHADFVALSKSDPILAAQITQEMMTISMPLGLVSTLIGALGIAHEHPNKKEDAETYASMMKVLDGLWASTAASAYKRLTAPPVSDTAMLTFDPKTLN